MTKHQTLCEIQPTEVYLSGFNALCTFSHLLHEAKKTEVKMKNDTTETTFNTRHNEKMEDKQMKTLH